MHNFSVNSYTVLNEYLDCKEKNNLLLAGRKTKAHLHAFLQIDLDRKCRQLAALLLKSYVHPSPRYGRRKERIEDALAFTPSQRLQHLKMLVAMRCLEISRPPGDPLLFHIEARTTLAEKRAFIQTHLNVSLPECQDSSVLANAIYYFKPPVSSESGSESTAVVEVLLELKADPSGIPNGSQCGSALHNCLDLKANLKLLIERGADTSTRDHAGDTLLHKIAYSPLSYPKEAVRLVLESHPNPMLKNRAGETSGQVVQAWLQRRIKTDRAAVMADFPVAELIDQYQKYYPLYLSGMQSALSACLPGVIASLVFNLIP